MSSRQYASRQYAVGRYQSRQYDSRQICSQQYASGSGQLAGSCAALGNKSIEFLKSR
jgi:hypothetical protein